MIICRTTFKREDYLPSQKIVEKCILIMDTRPHRFQNPSWTTTYPMAGLKVSSKATKPTLCGLIMVQHGDWYLLPKQHPFYSKAGRKDGRISLRVRTHTTKPFETLSWLGATLEVFLLLLFAQVSLRHRRLAWLPFIVWRSLVDSKRFSLLFTVSLRGCKGLRSTVQLPTNCSPPCEFWTFTHSPKSGDD